MLHILDLFLSFGSNVSLHCKKENTKDCIGVSLLKGGVTILLSTINKCIQYIHVISNIIKFISEAGLHLPQMKVFKSYLCLSFNCVSILIYATKRVFVSKGVNRDDCN